MARIIYGVSGQGFGHATRSKEVINHLKKQGHQVLVLSYGQALIFLAHEPNIEVYEVPGLVLKYRRNKLVYWQTVYLNVIQLFRQSAKWRALLARAKQFAPDLVIADFEPLSALLAKSLKKPLISLDNQHQLTNTKIEIPLYQRQNLLANKVIIRSLVRRADHYLVTTFFPTPLTNRHTDLVPAIIRQAVIDLQPKHGNYFLVYQTTGGDAISNVLKKFPQYHFIFYGLDRQATVGNIIYKKTSQDGFLQDLAGCQAVIGSAGLSLISESLYLGKPYLALPIDRQIEQVVNAIYLVKLGYGSMAKKLTSKALKNFVENLTTYDQNLEHYPRSGNEIVFKKLDQLIEELN